MGNWLLELDGALLLLIQALRLPLLNPVVAAYTHLGDAGLVWIALCLGMLCFHKTRKAGITGLLALCLGLLCTNVILKHLFQRARPWLVVEGLQFLVVEGDPNSFPSGHTCAAFAAAGAWYQTLPKRWGRIGLLAAALMGLSRLYVGVHFPSDVLAGSMVGLFCSWLAWRIWEGAAVHKEKRLKQPSDQGQ